ncbi:Ig-like domain-containing protein [Pseudomonas shirazensis]|uniref:Ig-like domain-containing protein n=1 Tax=Pseudomonas shirazensis TaxID=2745494 RepID=UPI003D280A30
MTRFSARLFPELADGAVPLIQRPLLVAGMITPVASADGGVNITVVNDDPDGVLAAIDPYLDMAAGDQLTVYIETKPMNPITVQESDVGKRVFLYLPVDWDGVEWVDDLHFEILRKGATVVEPSAPLRLRVKLYRPGGTDKEPHLPGHSELPRPKVPQDVIDNGVTAEWAQKGVPVTIDHYPDRAAEDVVVLSWGGVKVPRVITAEEAAGTAPVQIDVDQAVILAAGDSDALQLSHWPNDEVWNFASDRSRATTIKVEAGAWRLDAPIIKQATDGVIDLIDLGPSDVTVSIRIDQPPIAIGDSIEFTWVGTPAIGPPLVHTQTLRVDSVPQLLEATVPNRLVRSTAQGSGDASYVLRPTDGTPAQSSKRAFARIEGNIYEVPAPVILEAVEGLLDSAIDSAWVLAGPYPRMASGDLVNLVWRGKRADGTPYLHEDDTVVSEAQVDQALQFAVDGEHIRELAEGTLELYYRVTNDRVSVYDLRESDRSYYRVTSIRPTLPAPEVLESDGEVLDPAWIQPNGATLRVGYTQTAEGDLLTYHWRSVYPAGTSSDWLQITQGQQGRPVNFRISPALVEVSRNTTIVAFYTLKRESTGLVDVSDFLELYIGSPTPVAITGAVDSYGAVANGGVSVDTAVTLNGTARARSGVDMLDGGDKVGDAGANAEGIWQFPMTSLQPRSYSFTARARYGQRQESEPWAFTVVEYAVPSITRIEDSRRELAEGAATVDTAITVSGTASAGFSVEVMNGQALWRSVVVGPDGSWSLARGGLTVQSYEITAKAAYGGRDVSTPRAFRVVDELAPTLDSVQDSRGELADDKTTVDTQVQLAGKASIHQQVEVLDGARVVDTVEANATGEWTSTLRGLQVERHVIKARALYGAGRASGERRFTVVDYLFPTIESVRDSRGELLDGGATVDTSLTLTGNASASQQVEILDGNDSLGTPTVNPAGVWSLVLERLPVKRYGITAKALYGAGEQSPVRTFTIHEEVRPSITSVSDMDGDVVEAGTTVYDDVVVAGQASLNQRIELFEGEVSLAELPVDASGNWSYEMSGLQQRRYSLTAKALYGGGLVSPAHIFTAVGEVAPTISSIQDSRGEVAPGGFTFDGSVVVIGAASIGQRVELFDGGTPKDQAAVDMSGNWSTSVTGLGIGQHDIKAVALYGRKQDSGIRSFEVRQGAAPLITHVLDNKGQPIGNGDRSYETSFTLHGSAPADTQVQIFNNGTPGDIVSAADGNWQAPLSGLALGRHVFTAKGLYGDEPVSAEWIVTVKELIKPVITRAVDGNGQPIGNGERTYETSLTLHGTAQTGMQVQIFNNGTPGEIVSAADCNWQAPLSGLALGRHVFTAKGLYGEEPVSAEWIVTVEELIMPVITRAVDGNGQPIGNGERTYETSLTLHGTAQTGMQVQIFNNGTPGEIVSAADGNWQAPLSGLALGRHVFTAKGLYGEEPVSAEWIVTVEELIKPVITRAVDGNGQPIGNGGRTYETSLTLHGTAQTGMQVQVLDNGALRTTVPAPAGSWQAALNGLAAGRHVFTGKGLYGNEPVSNEWIVTVENRPPLRIDTSLMLLNGKVFVDGNSGRGPNPAPANASRQRVANGGVPSYTYSSSNPGVATVDGTGMVRSVSNGSTTITVRDQARQSASFSVTVQGVVRMYLMASTQYVVDWGQRIYMADLREVFNQYSAGGGLAQLGWPGGTYWSRDQRLNGFRQQAMHKDMNGGGEGWSAQLGPSYPGIRLG